MKNPATKGYRHQALAAVLGLAMGLSNLLGYLMVLLLTRSLGPADFGGYTALSTYGVLLAIPAGAFQIVVARRLSSGWADTGFRQTSGIGSAALLGVVFFAITTVLAPWLVEIFHVGSAWSAVFLAAMLPPMMLTGCFQGILLGRQRLRQLSILYLVTAVSRVLAAAVAATFAFSVRDVFAAMFLATLVSAATGAWLTRADLRSLPRSAHGLTGEMLRSNSTLAAYVALTNIDVLLARHFLDPHESGGYALASTFGRAMCWGTQFIALIIVPRMHGINPTRTLLRASLLVLTIGLCGTVLIAVDPGLFITLAGGAEFTEYGSLALICVLLGIAWALAQVWLFSEMSTDSGVLGALTWVVVGVQSATIWLWAHESPGQIVGVCLAGALLIAVAGLLRVLRGRRPPDGARPELLVLADGP